LGGEDLLLVLVRNSISRSRNGEGSLQKKGGGKEELSTRAGKRGPGALTLFESLLLALPKNSHEEQSTINRTKRKGEVCMVGQEDVPKCLIATADHIRTKKP